MKLIAFLGHHKVGSSALQTYLGRNALALLRRDILYPAVEGQGLATLLSMALSNPDGTMPDWPEGIDQPVNLREAHNALAFAMLAEHRGKDVPPLHEGLPRSGDMLRIIERQIEVFSPEVTILAAEVFANFAPISPKLIRRLLRSFSGAEITFTATLRRPDEYLVAWHGQRMRFGQKVAPLPAALDNYVRNLHFNYRKMLEGWITACPEADLRLRTYDDVRQAGGSVQDFMNGFGLPLPEDPARIPRVNESLHRAFFEIARQANATLPPGAGQELFQRLLGLGGHPDLPDRNEIEMYGAEARARMADAFAPIHDWLGEVSGRAPFFEDVEEIGRMRPVPEYDAARAALAILRGPAGAELPEGLREFLASLELGPNFE